MTLSINQLKTTNEFTHVKTEVFQLNGYKTEHARLERCTTITRSEGKTSKNVGGYYLTGSVRKFGSTYRPQFVKPEFFKYIETNHAFSDYKKLSELAIEPPSETVDENWEIIWFDSSSHTLLDQKHNPLPYAYSYDYIGTPFSNQYVKLDDNFLNFLRNHPWVANKGDIRVLDIPYYNAEPDMDRYVQVMVRPDLETYREMWDYYYKVDKKFPSCRVKDAICGYLCLFNPAERDWFGIRPFLKNPPKG
jgi:hypothetical protein